MSTILEALKKSEQERQPGAVPVLATAQAPDERKPFWFWLSLALVFLLLLAFAAWLFLNYSAKASSPISQPTAPYSMSVEIAGGSPKDAPSQTAQENQNLPKVDVISYSDNPDRRFVIINGATIREGEFFEAGAKVEKILSNVVVLNVRGEQIIVRP